MARGSSHPVVSDDLPAEVAGWLAAGAGVLETTRAADSWSPRRRAAVLGEAGTYPPGTEPCAPEVSGEAEPCRPDVSGEAEPCPLHGTPAADVEPPPNAGAATAAHVGGAAPPAVGEPLLLWTA